MKKDAKVLLTEKWWNDNKAKTLPDKAGLGKALKPIEGAMKLAAVSKGGAKAASIKAASEALAAAEDAAAKTAKNCIKGVHGDTAHVLTKTFPAKVKEYQSMLDKMLTSLNKELNALTPIAVMKDKTLRVAFMQYAKARFVSENPNFLLVASKKDAGVYNEFIRAGASQQINISNALRSKFDEAMANNDLANAPWKKAIDEVITLMASNDIGPFAKYILEGK